MSASFTLHLLGATGSLQLDEVESFVGQDESGSFGIMAGHERMLAVLSYGLARFQRYGEWTYLALPGGVLHFFGGSLYIVTRRFFLDADYERISATLMEKLHAEEEKLLRVKDNISRLEREMMRRLWLMAEKK